MALRKFRVVKVKALGLAECDSVPKIMVIAGPNGVGKSTLLFEISRQRGTESDAETKFLYQPPHRAIRKTTVQRRWLYGAATKIFGDLLSQSDVSGYDGLNIPFPSRAPDNVDEAGSTIKYSLGKIEERRKGVLASLVDVSKKQGKPVATDDEHIPDVYLPLRQLTQYLLPHLAFDRVDFQNEDNIRCVWKRKDKQGELELDLDDLSSGEKSIVILFLPLLENEMNRRLEEISKGKSEAELTNTAQDRVLIVDEPELHLHPDLQSKILTYLRRLSGDSKNQFIISTHSPTILDQALDDELYLLTQKSDNPQENQLKKIATNLDKLEALKQLTGDTYLVTTGRSIVCIEGTADATAKPADVRLFQILYPRSTAFTFVPAGGKGEVIRIVKKLREHLPPESFGIKVFGLTDKDQSTTSVDGIFKLPVCMIENLLLNPVGIHKYLQTVGVVKYTTPEEVKTALETVAEGLKQDELSFRVMREIGSHTVRLRADNVEALKKLLAEEIKQVQALLPDDKTLTKIIDDAGSAVSKVISEKTTLADFRGKAILERFYQENIAEKNISYSVYCYDLASHVASTGDVEKLLNPVFDKMT